MYWLSDIGCAFYEVSHFFGSAVNYICTFYDSLPPLIRTMLSLVLFFAVAGILLSHILGIYRNRNEWKPMPGNSLMFSYFCGSGQYQRKKIYQEAHKLLRDVKWLWFSIAGLAYRLGNFESSKILMFACSLLYLPMALLGFVEMALRIAMGTIWLLCFGLAHRLLLFVLQCVSSLLIPLWLIVDKSMRVKQHCPHCYTAFDLPGFKCPDCGIIHKRLIPSRCGILVARCECGCFFPSAAFSGRSNLAAVCPKCNGDLVVANAKQFTIQLVGGNTSGKTAFLAAFQHIYLDNNNGTERLSVYGEPRADFQELDEMFQSGKTVPSSAAAVVGYNFVHRFGRSAKHNLIMYDIPDEVILSGDYEKNPLNLGYSDGILLMVDPLSIASVREECVKAGDNQAVQNYSTDDVEAIIVRFMQQFSEIVGRSARKMIDIPVAVLISKADIKLIKNEVGAQKIATTSSTHLALAQDEICRKYLLKLGLANALNNLESVFSNVHYFAISAMGHLSEEGKPFKPFDVMEPMIWIAKARKASIHALLQNEASE